MTTQDITTQDITKGGFTIPKFDEFCNLLQDRFHYLLERFSLLRSKENIYTVFIAIKDKKKEEDREGADEKQFYYAGFQQQIKTLEKQYGKKGIFEELKDKIEYLGDTPFSVKDSTLTRQVFSAAKKNELSFSSKIEKPDKSEKVDLYHFWDLEKYYKTIQDNDELSPKEEKILEKYGFLDGHHKFIIIPIIGFARFDGVAYIAFKEKDKSICPICQEKEAKLQVSCTKNNKVPEEKRKKLGIKITEDCRCNNVLEEKSRILYKQQEQIRLITQLFSHEYEGQLLDWQTYASNMYEDSNIDAVGSYKRASETNKNPIFEELNLVKYYKESKFYFEKRRNLNDEIPRTVQKQLHKAAIVAILLDSYSHNIGAHALSELNWLFRQRAEKLMYKIATKYPKTYHNKIKLSQTQQNFANDFVEKNGHKTGVVYNEVIPLAQNNLIGLIHSAIRDYKLPIKDTIKGELGKAISKISDELEYPIIDYDCSKIQFEQSQAKIKEIKGDDDLPIPITHYALPLAREIQPLFKFLQEKGAFWNGSVTDSGLGGKISSLYSILWNDFINNSLYLGTIAASEGIYKINVHLTIIESSEPQDHEKRVIEEGGKKIPYTIEYNKKTKLTGKFATVDITKVNRFHLMLENEKETNDRDLLLRSFFVDPGEDFESLRKELKKPEYRIFFPSNNVGKHAFFTLIENELRNVKHFSPEEQQKMKKDGLNLHLSIENVNVRRGEGNGKELYKIGVWLGHKTLLIPEKKGESASPPEDLLSQRIKDLGSDIIDENNYQPKMGGSYQDKVCAAQLMNNTFGSVQNEGKSEEEINQKRNTVYYPWIKIGATGQDYKNNNIIKEIEMSYRNYRRDQIVFGRTRRKILRESLPEDGQGYLKKFFHLWKGEYLYKVKKDKSLDDWENPARFKIIVTPIQTKEDKKIKGDLFLETRKKGIVRIIEQQYHGEKTPDTQGTTTLEYLDAYHTWLKKWLILEEKKGVCINIELGKSTLCGKILFHKTKEVPRKKQVKDTRYNKYFNFYNKEEIDDDCIPDSFEAEEASMEKVKLKVVHGSNIAVASESSDAGYVSYRSHGIFIKHFCNEVDIKDSDDVNISNEKLPELIEVLFTKVCIFDNRVHKRIYNALKRASDIGYRDTKNKTYREQLHLNYFDEKPKKWQEERDKKGGFTKNYNLLIVHLSFIDSLGKSEYKSAKAGVTREGYTEKNINNFIKYEILDGKDIEKIDSFLLIVVSGRGRRKWFDKLVSQYVKFTTSRPIEPLTTGIENALSIADDIELKYQIIKSSFGS